MDSSEILGIHSQQTSIPDRCRYNVRNMQISPTIIYLQTNSSKKINRPLPTMKKRTEPKKSELCTLLPNHCTSYNQRIIMKFPLSPRFFSIQGFHVKIMSHLLCAMFYLRTFHPHSLISLV